MENSANNNAQQTPANLDPKVLSEIATISSSDEKVKNALEAAKKAMDSADAASKKSACWSFTGKDKKEAIEALQKSGIELAIGIQNVADAQKVMFDNLKIIAKATNSLFGLGVSNIACTRAVIDIITTSLKDASKQKLSERARESLMSVVQQLKAQEDLFNKVEKLSNRCKLLEEEILTIKGTENAQSNELSLTGLTRKMLENYNVLLERINTQTNLVKSETESLIYKVHNDSEKRLYEEKVLLEKKTSTLNLWCLILGGVSIINLLISVFIFSN